MELGGGRTSPNGDKLEGDESTSGEKHGGYMKGKVSMPTVETLTLDLSDYIVKAIKVELERLKIIDILFICKGKYMMLELKSHLIAKF